MWADGIHPLRKAAGTARQRSQEETGGEIMIHLYCGDGKGKTTCAMGLALPRRQEIFACLNRFRG